MARGRRLAFGAREKHEVLPAFGGGSEWHRGQWDIEHDNSGGGEGGSIRLRPERCGADDWRAAVLRGAADGDWSGGPAAGGGARGRAGLFDGSVCKRYRSDRASFAGPVCEQLGGGYGL